MTATRAMIGQVAPCPYCRTPITIGAGQVGQNFVTGSAPIRSIFDEVKLPEPIDPATLPAPDAEYVSAHTKLYQEMLRKLVHVPYRSTALGRGLCTLASILAILDAAIWLTVTMRFLGPLFLLFLVTVTKETALDYEKWGLALLVTVGPLFPGMLAAFAGVYVLKREDWKLAAITAVMTVVLRFALHRELMDLLMTVLTYGNEALVPPFIAESIYVTWIVITVAEFFIVMLPITRQEFAEPP